MINRFFFAATLLVAVVGIAVSSNHLPDEADPEFPASAFEVHTHGRLFLHSGDLSGMFEYVGRFEDADREFRYQGFTAGTYYRILRNLKLGAFFRVQVGARHDDDWIEQGATWFWIDSSNRSEPVVMLDATPRFLLDFLPGENWVLAVKNRYEYNLYNQQQSLLVRPGLTWFWLKDREPVLNVSAQYATYLSLNFGTTPVYQSGPYLNVLYHVSPGLKLDASVSRQRIYWSESADFLMDFPTETYATNLYTPWVVDVGFILDVR